MSRIIVPRRDLILPNRHKQRGFIINPYVFGAGAVDPTALSIYNKIVAWWEHAGNSASAVLDSHTGGYHLTAAGTFTYDQTALASGLPTCTKFGTANTRMTANHAAALNLGSSYSVMAWFKRDGAQATNAKIIVKPTDIISGRATYYLQYTNATGKLLARFNSGSEYYDISGATTIANLTTYQAIFNKNTTGSELFLNNVSDGTQASGGAPDTGTNQVHHGEVGGSNDGFIGFYGSMALFSSPLTSTERAYLYNSGNGVGYAALKMAAGF